MGLDRLLMLRKQVPDIRLLRSADPRVAGQMARPGQRNRLVRVVLRHLERTLTDDEANALRDRVYAAVHQGTRHQWALAPERVPSRPH
jgi:hypothetical protein